MLDVAACVVLTGMAFMVIGLGFSNAALAKRAHRFGLIVIAIGAILAFL